MTLSIMTQHNDTQHNDTQHNDTQHNDTRHNDTQHNDTQHNNNKYDTRHDSKDICYMSFMLYFATEPIIRVLLITPSAVLSNVVRLNVAVHLQRQCLDVANTTKEH
jgi:hypothetical protein